MRKSYLKRVISSICAIALLIGMNNVVLADTESQYIELTGITTAELENYAINFSKSYTNNDLTVGEITPVYESDNSLVGYSVSYYDLNGTPYGYINLDFTREDPVTEFVIQKEARSMYSYIEGLVQEEFSYDYDVEEKLYCTNELEYTVSVTGADNEEFYYNTNDGEMNSSEFHVLKNAEREDAYLETTVESTGSVVYDSHSELFSKTYQSGSTIVLEPTYTSKYSKSKSLISETRIKNLTSKYACAVLALTEIAYQEGILLDSSIASTFNALWSETQTYVLYEKEFGSKMVSYGTTYDSKLALAMKNYAIAQGKTQTTASSKSNPAFSFFVNAIDGNYSATLSYRIYVVDEEASSGYSKSGHTVNVVGYCTAKKSGTTSKYLIVADGWYSDAPKYINYTSVDFVNTYGVKYIIK